tara:strand:- start:8082 stop:8591 length:510 start_codon:yes stop_codon:yes gene_type:complete
MAVSTIPKVRRDGTITLLDGGTDVLDIQYEEGNLTIDNLSSSAREDQTVIRDRGSITTVRKGDQQPLTGSFTAYFRQFTSGTAGAILDFIQKTGAYNSNISTAATGTPYVEFHCVNIKYNSDGTAVGDDTDSSVTLERCVCTASFSEGDPSTFTINFTVYGAVSYTGTT